MEQESNYKSGIIVSIYIISIIQIIFIILKLYKIKPIEIWSWYTIFIPTISCCSYFIYINLSKLCKKKEENSLDTISENLVDLNETESY